MDGLIAGCRRNERRAQEQLYRRLYGPAMRIALRYASDPQVAGSILSQAFVKMFRSISSYDPQKGALEAWLYRIVVNEALNHLRQEARFSSRELETVDEPPVNNAIIEKMNAEAIMLHIRRLPPATHAVFVLFACEGYGHKEIAQQLGISEGTSKWHLSEARRILQKQLTNQP
jgi:RNA polymerase sigma factor (sigma-70 family)